MAAAAANRLSAYFPRSAASDPEIFAAGLIELLAGYPPWVLVELCSVTTGMPARHTFMPSIAEVREFCARAVEERRRHEELVARPARMPLPAPAGDRSGRPTYAELVARAAARGVTIGDARARRGRASDAVSIAEVVQRLGITRAQWDAIPNRESEVATRTTEIRGPISDS